MMRTSLTLCLLCLLTMLVSCDKIRNDDVIPGSVYPWHVWPGDTVSIKAECGDIRSAVSLDTAIAVTWMEKGKVVVAADGIGYTDIALIGQDGEEVPQEVSTRLAGVYHEDHGVCAPVISIITESPDIKDSILKDISEYTRNLNHVQYAFNFTAEKNCGTYIQETFSLYLPDHSEVQGSFYWDGSALRLEYADISETYSFKGKYDGPYSQMFSITMDLTERYALMYPDAVIENVSVERVLIAVPPYV